MTADDLALTPLISSVPNASTRNTSARAPSTSDLTGQPATAPVGSQSLERWARAVAAPILPEARFESAAPLMAGPSDAPPQPNLRAEISTAPINIVAAHPSDPSVDIDRALKIGREAHSPAHPSTIDTRPLSVTRCEQPHQPAAPITAAVAAPERIAGLESGPKVAKGPTERGSLSAQVLPDHVVQHWSDTATTRLQHAPPPPPSTQTFTEPGRMLSLSELRGLHAQHRQGRASAEAATLDGSQAAVERSTDAARLDGTALSMPVEARPSKSGSPVEGSISAAGRQDELHSLIESCCNRLWVSETPRGAPQGVMLDLGRWMPGCTIEVAKAAGLLRITLRGVDEARRHDLSRDLDQLSSDLAQKLGCQVVTAVAGGQESPR